MPTVPDSAPDPRAAPRFEALRTERLTLRPLRPGDAAELHRLVNDWEVAKNLSRVPFPYPRSLADDWIASTLAQIEAGTAWHLAITGLEHAGTPAEREVLVGCIGLTRGTEKREAELGYWVGRRFWGHGVATEAAARLVSWALANLELDRLVAATAFENTASQALLARIGFRRGGEGVRESRARGGPMPVQIFELTRADLPAAAGSVWGERSPAQAGPAAAPAAGGQAELAARPANLLLVAACALVDSDGRVLLARRPEGKPMAGLWEFPGGKVRPDETPEAGLIRELREELGIDVSAACLAPFTFASQALGERHLLMPLYLCRRWEGRVQALEGQALAWVRPQRLGDYAMPPADRPLVALLRDFL